MWFCSGHHMMHSAEAHTQPLTGSANSRQVGGDHYQMAIQPWDFIVANEIPFLEATAMVYILRHKRKAGKQDLEKARHYIDKMIEVYYPEKKI